MAHGRPTGIECLLCILRIGFCILVPRLLYRGILEFKGTTWCIMKLRSLELLVKVWRRLGLSLHRTRAGSQGLHLLIRIGHISQVTYCHTYPSWELCLHLTSYLVTSSSSVLNTESVFPSRFLVLSSRTAHSGAASMSFRLQRELKRGPTLAPDT